MPNEHAEGGRNGAAIGASSSAVLQFFGQRCGARCPPLLSNHVPGFCAPSFSIIREEREVPESNFSGDVRGTQRPWATQFRRVCFRMAGFFCRVPTSPPRVCLTGGTIDHVSSHLGGQWSHRWCHDLARIFFLFITFPVMSETFPPT